MTTWRKCVAILMSVLLVCALFAGCGGGEQTPGLKKLHPATTWHNRSHEGAPAS